MKTISILELDNVTGGRSANVQAYIDCHNKAVNDFNRADRLYQQNTPWYEKSDKAEDAFGEQLQAGHQACIDAFPLRRNPNQGF